MLNKVKARFLIGVGGLIAVSFMVMIGYTIGSQTISKQTANQIRAEANKLVSKKKQEERATVLSDERACQRISHSIFHQGSAG
ncbi:parvulin-like peptidyl-prolyl isomerase [Streptococcus suis]|nr:parvulin-like peptidyl-prolyl isomerase [Streptococcus suis]